LLFSFALKYSIRKFKVNQAGLKLNGMHQLLVHVVSVNILGENLTTKKESTKAPLHARETAGLEMNTEKTKYMDMSHL
jgi:hypothetical protein